MTASPAKIKLIMIEGENCPHCPFFYVWLKRFVRKLVRKKAVEADVTVEKVNLSEKEEWVKTVIDKGYWVPTRDGGWGPALPQVFAEVNGKVIFFFGLSWPEKLVEKIIEERIKKIVELRSDPEKLEEQGEYWLIWDMAHDFPFQNPEDGTMFKPIVLREDLLKKAFEKGILSKDAVLIAEKDKADILYADIPLSEIEVE